MRPKKKYELSSEGELKSPIRPSTKYFQGEDMVCQLCWKVERSDPDRDTQWRCIEADGEPYYFCGDHFPPEGSSVEAYEAAYRICLNAIMSMR